LVSRHRNQYKSFETLRDNLSKLRAKNAILDGEIVCLDSKGCSQFKELLYRRGRAVLYAFDLVWLNGMDLRPTPLIERKKKLKQLIHRSPCSEIIYAQHVEGEGKLLFEEVCERNLEGMVCKRKASVVPEKRPVKALVSVKKHWTNTPPLPRLRTWQSSTSSRFPNTTSLMIALSK
jgi:ATP-dependent DNA ligase